jgi:tripartite-type tricarboxylate transporter receptor subunit TctC
MMNPSSSKSRRTFRFAVYLTACAAVSILSGAAQASDQAEVEQFYRGRSINLIVGFNPGGSADLYARLITRHIVSHIPGNPNIVVRNMQGASSLNAANYVYNRSPRDGTEIGLFAGNILTDPIISDGAFKFDAQKFHWIGAPSAAVNVCISSQNSSIKTFRDAIASEMLIGTTGTAGNSTYDFPVVLNNVMGTKFKLVKGYAGSAAMNLALSRNEIEGFCGVGLSFLQNANLADGKSNILIQMGLAKSRDLPDVPFIMDFARSEEERQVFKLIFGWLNFERPIGAPPETPSARVGALREAFNKTMTDHAFLEEAKKVKADIEPMSGADLQKFLVEVYQTPRPITEKVAEYLGRKPRN